jgi:hypothetical protein
VTALGVEVYESWGVEVLLPRVHLVPDLAGKAVHRPMPPMGAAPFRPATGATAQPAGQSPIVQPKPPARPEARPAEKEAKTVFAFEPPPGFGKLDGFAPMGEKQPPPKPEPDDARRDPRVWSGTQPGVMAGKRPAPRPKGRPK